MRRRLSLAGLVVAFVLALWPQAQAPAVAALRASGKIVARQVDHSMPAYTVGELRRDTGERVDAIDAGSTGGATLSVTSPVIDAGQLFERVGVHYRAAWGAEDSLIVEVRTSADARTWTGWTIYHPEEDLADTATNTWYIAPQVAPQDSRYAQYRVWLTDGDPAALQHVALTFLDVNDLNAGPVARFLNDIGGALQDVARAYSGEGRGLATAAPVGPARIVTRQEWGADEGLASWDPKYVPWQKAVIHHTVTGDGGSDPAAEIRAIYYFHAVTRGWGDIGYHWIVDKNGNIYQGRYGGDHVVGGHAFGWNDGSFGIAALGDYNVVSPSPALQSGIASVIAMRFRQHGIGAPFGASYWPHKEQRADGEWTEVVANTPNVIGHRDCTFQVGISGGQTACPGGRLYTRVQDIKTLAQGMYDQGFTYLTRIDPQLAAAGFPGQQTSVPVAVTNRGAVTIPAETAVSYQLLRQGALVSGGPSVRLGQALAPGTTAVVTVPFTAPPKGEYIVRWGLQSGTAWWSALYDDPVRDQWFRSNDWSARWEPTQVPSIWTAGSGRPVTVSVKNDGGRTWNASGTNPVRIGYYWTSTATGNRFDGAVKMSLPADVPPGGEVRVTLPVVAPLYPTNYALTFDLHKENEFWFRDKGLRPDDQQIAVAVDWKAQYTLPAPLPRFEASKPVKLPVTITNTGLGIFPVTSSYPVNLGYHWYDRAGRAVVWDGTRAKLGADLPPGRSVTLEAEVTGPPEGGDFTLRFDLVQEGVSWFSAMGVGEGSALVAVAGPVIPAYAAAYESGITTLARSGSLTAVPFTLRNTSNFTWKAGGADPVRLSYHWVDAQGRTVAWDGLRTLLPRDVAPGESVQVDAQVAIPAAEGTYTLKWDLVHEGVTWFSAKGVRTFDQTVVVGPPPSYGGSVTVTQTPGVLPLRVRSIIPVRVTNASDFDWDALVNLSYHWYDTSGNTLVWDGVRTPLAGMKAGESRVVDASVLAPGVAGTYVLRFDLVHEMVTWFSGRGMALTPVTLRVDVAPYAAQYDVPDAAEGALNGTITVPVLVTNHGGMTWQPGEVNLAYHLYAESGGLYVWDGARTALKAPLGSGQSVLLKAEVRVPERAGRFTVRFDLVQEGVTWFSGQRVAPSTGVTLTVK